MTERTSDAPLVPQATPASPPELTTVHVPPDFRESFLRAQEYVARYFADRVEDPDSATISIAGERYVLLRAASLSVEFVELVTKLYQDKGPAEAREVANNLLFDFAHAVGKADARSFQRKMGVSSPIENLSAGPIHFAFSGWAFVDIHAESHPTPDEEYVLVYDHPFSFESHSWMAKGRHSDGPVCIMNAGYSSGWCAESFGMPLVSVEIECQAAGDEHCRFIMAPPSRIEEHLARYAARGRAEARGVPRAPSVPEFFQRKRLEDELRAANERLEERVEKRTRELERATDQLRLLGSAVEHAEEGVVIMAASDDGDPLVITFVNRGFSRITGHTGPEVVGRSPASLAVAEEDRGVFDALFASVRRHEPFEAEVGAVRPDGSVYALELHVMPVARGAGRPSYWIAILRDVSDRKAHVDALQHQALHDALTGLPNRLLLHDRIDQNILAMRRQGSQFALLFMDLDGFKEINDTFGHHTGDVLLSKVGARLRANLRSTDTIARLGGDEFAVVLGNVGELREGERLAAKLLAALEKPFTVDDQTLVVGASVGIAYCPDHGTDPATLMRRADVAMYAAKAARAGTMTYDARRDQHSPARLQRIAELRASVDNEHLLIEYQPVIELATGVTRRAEALLRWRRDDGGVMLPGEFLPLIGNSESMERVTRWVLDRAVRDCRSWQDVVPDVGVAVNLPPNALRDATLAGAVGKLLERHGLPANLLTLEITEQGILGDTAAVAETCERLRELGVALAIDDFGTGYSSLMHLKRLPFTELKVDPVFTGGMLTTPRDGAIVRAIVDLGHELGHTIVAEGVENEATLRRLRELGCDLAQGFQVARPMGLPALRDWFRK